MNGTIIPIGVISLMIELQRKYLQEKLFDVFLYSPTHPSSAKCLYFHDLLLFTTKSGLFSEATPQ